MEVFTLFMPDLRYNWLECKRKKMENRCLQYDL